MSQVESLVPEEINEQLQGYLDILRVAFAQSKEGVYPPATKPIKNKMLIKARNVNQVRQLSGNRNIQELLIGLYYCRNVISRKELVELSLGLDMVKMINNKAMQHFAVFNKDYPEISFEHHLGLLCGIMYSAFLEKLIQLGYVSNMILPREFAHGAKQSFKLQVLELDDDIIIS